MRAKKDINVRVGNQIRIAREAAGLTQEKFAELVALAPKNVSDVERGVVGVSLSAIIRICEVLSISSDQLLFGNRDIARGTCDVASIASRLGNLPDKQFQIASDIINKVLEAFASPIN